MKAQKHKVGRPVGAPTLTHRGYQLMRFSPSRWPACLRRTYERRVGELMALPHLEEKHRSAVIGLVRAELVAAALFEHGATKRLLDGETGELVPALKQLPVWLNTISRYCQVLGLTPLVNARVVAKGDGLLAALAGLDDVTDADTGEVQERGNGHGEAHD